MSDTNSTTFSIPRRGAALTNFKNATGAYITKGIFWELDTSDHSSSVYTIHPEDREIDGVVYPSLRRLYIELSDPTEYQFASLYLGGWQHWKRMTETAMLKPIIKEWREELETKLRSEALARIKTRAQGNSKDSLQADKILLSGGWKSQEEKDRAGRPSRQKIKEEADKLLKERSVFDEDFERLNLQ